MGMPLCVVMRQGTFELGASITAQQLLAECRAGAYTTAMVVNGHEVVDWGLHVQRLAR